MLQDLTLKAMGIERPAHIQRDFNTFEMFPATVVFNGKTEEETATLEYICTLELALHEHRQPTAVSGNAVDLTPIEHCDQQNRDYIPLAGSYEWQSKGNGSTIRIVGPNGERHPLSWNPPHVVKLLEDMIRAQHTALTERKAYGEACRHEGRLEGAETTIALGLQEARLDGYEKGLAEGIKQEQNKTAS